MPGTTQVEQFHEQGYLVVRDVVDVALLDAVREEYTQALRRRLPAWLRTQPGHVDAIAQQETFEDQVRMLAALPGFDPSLLAELDITLPHMPFAVIRHDTEMHTGPAVLALLSSDAILDTVEPILGGEISASPNQHCRLKLPVDDGPPAFAGRTGETMYAQTMWHQDAMTQMPQSDATPLVTCWVPVHDVAEEHGCLVVVPGEHRNESLLAWPADAEAAASLEARAVSLPVQRGDVVLLHKRTPHGSRHNRSPRLRWSFDFRYFPTGMASDRPWFPSVVVRSRANPAAVSLDASQWRARWQQARTMMAERGQPVPGRRDFARMVADAMMRRWESGDHPVLDGEGWLLPAMVATGDGAGY